MKKKITLSVIKKLNPCKNRLDNYIKFYGNKEFRNTQFMGLKNITQGDKLWVAFRLMPKENIRLAAADIAESVLHLFEAKYPNDTRPREAIVAARSGDKTTYAAYAAYAAVETADAAAAYAASAAYAAAAAAAYAYAAYAYAANAAAAYDAAAYAASAAAAYAYAASAATYAASDRTAQEGLIRKITLKYWK